MTRTNAYSVLCVIIRVFALWLFMNTAMQLPAAFLSAHGMGTHEQLLSLNLAGSTFLFVFAAVLWVYADKFAKIALARPQQVVFESDVTVQEWQALSFSVVGLWQFVDGLIYSVDRIIELTRIHFDIVNNALHIDLPAEYITWLCVDVLRMLIGLWLIFGATGIVGLIRRYRQIGYTHSEATQSSDSSEASATKSDPNPPL